MVILLLFIQRISLVLLAVPIDTEETASGCHWIGIQPMVGAKDVTKTSRKMFSGLETSVNFRFYCKKKNLLIQSVIVDFAGIFVVGTVALG